MGTRKVLKFGHLSTDVDKGLSFHEISFWDRKILSYIFYMSHSQYSVPHTLNMLVYFDI